MFTLSLRALPALNLGHFEALILIVSPVLGLRPVLSPLVPTSKVPKPTSCTDSPFAKDSVTASIKAFRVASVSFFVRPVFFVISSIKSFLVFLSFKVLSKKLLTSLRLTHS